MVLAVPALPDRASGSRLTAAIYKTDVTDAVNFLANPPQFIGTQNASQAIANGSWAAITLDVELTDSYDGHSLVTNTSRYTAQVTGWYEVCGVVSWSNSSTVGSRGARLHVNGTPLLGSAVVLAAGTLPAAVATATRTVFLNAADYVEVAGGQNSGGSLSTVNSGVDATSGLWVSWSHV